jgi:hypothetical protein
VKELELRAEPGVPGWGVLVRKQTELGKKMIRNLTEVPTEAGGATVVSRKGADGVAVGTGVGERVGIGVGVTLGIGIGVVVDPGVVVVPDPGGGVVVDPGGGVVVDPGGGVVVDPGGGVVVGTEVGAAGGAVITAGLAVGRRVAPGARDSSPTSTSEGLGVGSADGSPGLPLSTWLPFAGLARATSEPRGVGLEAMLFDPGGRIAISAMPRNRMPKKPTKSPTPSARRRELARWRGLPYSSKSGQDESRAVIQLVSGRSGIEISRPRPRTTGRTTTATAEPTHMATTRIASATEAMAIKRRVSPKRPEAPGARPPLAGCGTAPSSEVGSRAVASGGAPAGTVPFDPRDPTLWPRADPAARAAAPIPAIGPRMRAFKLGRPAFLTKPSLEKSGAGAGVTAEAAAAATSSSSSWWARMMPGTSRPGGRT